MKTKEYLGQYIKAKRYAERCFERMKAIDVNPRSPRLDGMPKATSSGSDLADTVARIVEIKKTAETAYQKMLILESEISDVIEAVPDLDEKMLLRLRYIEGLKWNEVAETMHMAERTVFYLHGDALNSAELYRKSRHIRDG